MIGRQRLCARNGEGSLYLIMVEPTATMYYSFIDRFLLNAHEFLTSLMIYGSRMVLINSRIYNISGNWFFFLEKVLVIEYR